MTSRTADVRILRWAARSAGAHRHGCGGGLDERRIFITLPALYYAVALKASPSSPGGTGCDVLVALLLVLIRFGRYTILDFSAPATRAISRARWRPGRGRFSPASSMSSPRSTA